MDTLIERLQVEFADRQSRNPGYSMRAFSRDLNVNITSLSLILARKRKPSPDLRKTIAEKLALAPQLAALEEGGHGESRLLEDDEFRLIADWVHMALLNLLRPGCGPRSIEELEQRLELPHQVIRTALERLCRLNFVVAMNDNQYQRVVESVRTSQDVPSAAIRRMHADGLELAKRALEEVPVTERECSTVFLMMNPGHIQKAKDIMRRFRSEFISVFDPKLKVSSRSRLYMLSLSMFPVENKR